MSKWYEFYQQRLNDRYIKHLETRYDYFLSRIENQIWDLMNCKQIDRIEIVELGSGCSNISRILYDRFENFNHRIKFTAVEIDNKMIELSTINIGSRSINLIKGNILHIVPLSDFSKTATILISHGVLEHFKDKDILKILGVKLNMMMTKHFHYVPSYMYDVQSFGDERLLTKEYWEKLCKKIPSIDFKIEIFNNGYDYLIMRKGE